jgi:ribosomal protein L11 methyltransferase
VIRLAVRVGRARAELVLAQLLELAPDGVEEVAVDEHVVEYAVYGAPGELPSLPQVTGAVGAALVAISTTELSDDWHERWKAFHRPVLLRAPRLGGASKDSERRAPVAALHVRAPWQPACQRDDLRVHEIVIDPGQAFGTGAHATTRLCLELLLQLAQMQPPLPALLDVGTGSGVLAIAGAKLGFEPVLGVDHARESVAAARANAALNAVSVEMCQLDLRAQRLPLAGDCEGEPGRVLVVANLVRPLLLELAATIAFVPARMILGGLLAHEASEVAASFQARLGMRELGRRARGEWTVLLLGADG